MLKYLIPACLFILDSLIIVSAAVSVVGVRFENEQFSIYLEQMVQYLPILLLCYLPFFGISRLYRRVWRHAGYKELSSIASAAFAGTVCFFVVTSLFYSVMPRSVYVLLFFFILAGVGLSRLILRCILRYSDMNKAPSSAIPVIIIGAGYAGNLVASDILNHNSYNRYVVGFIDDDEEKHGELSFGIEVLGGRDKIQEVVDKFGVKEIIIAIPSLSPKESAELAAICSKTKCKVKIVPDIYAILDEYVSIKNLRPVNIGDLLQRDPVVLDIKKISHFLSGKCVLVTGAGGSIGSELCRKIIQMKPSRLLLLGKGENSIYEIHRELSCLHTSELLVPIVASVRDRKGLEEVFARYKPQVVFHAAAHKHVPLMEAQPIEAVKNNVFGTLNVGTLSGEYGVEAFVMVSTDKAVNPTSVMGATKRVAEKIIRVLNEKYATKYVAVRFGNVLGSRGSVVPLFKKQIEAGGPVTVTDPEIVRYFMTIPEASMLVLQASTMGKGGEVFVLDMGEPIKILDLAKNMIRLSGLEPGVDIKIDFIGLRPGEKLFEELLTSEEGTLPTMHKQIFSANLLDVEFKNLEFCLSKFENCKCDIDVINVLKEIVPTYKPNHF